MSQNRRRRPARGRPVDHVHEPSPLPSRPEEWPSGREIAAAAWSVDALTAEALEQVTADDLVRVLKSMPPSHQQFVLGVLGLRSKAATVNRGMATQLLARLRGGDPAARAALLRDVTVPVLAALDASATPAQWRAMLGPNDKAALVAYGANRTLTDSLSEAVRVLSPALLTAGLTAAISADTAAAAIALALLATEHPPARAAHAALKADHPALPPVPAAPLADLGPAARLARLGVSKGDVSGEELADLLDDLLDDAEADEEAGAPLDADPAATGPTVSTAAESAAPFAPVAAEASVDDVMDRAADLLAEWDDTTAVAADVLDALQGGQLPQTVAVAQIARATELGGAVVSELSKVLGSPVPPTRDGVEAALSALEAREAAASDHTWLQQLTELQGPPALETALAEVRSAAAAAMEDVDATREPLAALWQLLELTAVARRGESVDFAALGAAQTTAMTAWPASAALVPAIAVGAVALPDPAPGRAEVPPASTPANDIGTATQPAAAPAGQPEDADDVRGHRAADGATALIPADPGDAGTPTSRVVDAGSASGDAPVDETGPGTEDHEPPSKPGRSGDGVRGSATSEEKVTAMPDDSAAASDADAPDFSDETHDADDLDDLDALLDAGAGAALAAVSSPRRRPVTDPPPTADSADTTVAAPVARPDVEVTPADVAAAAAAVLPDERFGLAADLLEAAASGDASVAARRLTAYAAALISPTGRLASAFAELAPQVTRDALGEDRGGQLLALTAAARVALLAPSAGPASVLLDLLPCVREQLALTEALSALADGSRSGIVVVAETADAVGTLAAAENDAAAAAANAAELVAGASRRVIKYIPANGVYQAWMNADADGELNLGKLLRQVAANDISAVGEVRDSVVKLRGKAHKAIDATFAEQRRNHSNRIVAGARGTLLTRWEEAVELAARWASLAERVVERQAAMSAGAWQALPMTKLRHRLAEVREGALTELAAQRTGDIHDAAVQAAHELLAEAFAICDGTAPTGEEPPTAFAAHAELLASDLPLDAETLLPDGGLAAAHLPVLLALAAAPSADTATVYAHRADHGDHDLTGALIAGVRADDPTTAAALDRRRSADITTQAGDVLDEVSGLGALIDTRRMAGTLDDQPWAALAARVEALADPTRRDFGRIRADVAAVTSELDEHEQRKIRETLGRIDDRIRDNADVAGNADVLTDLARSGHVASAEEYLETVLAGGKLPSAPGERVDHLARFFPAVPEAAAAHTALLADLHAALGGGAGHGGPEHLTAAGLDVGALSEARRDAGRKALGAWAALTGRSSHAPRVDLNTALQAVLAQAGLEFATAKQEPTRSTNVTRQWIRLSGVTVTGEALTPVLGSAMSPDGGTLRVLLVKQAPSPATVIEWMGQQTPDHTVVALWLAGALSAADRRAIADAARGRPNPPLLVLDAAALAYLVCQNEPRQATFVATALPFTAANPYRDTPGDTPPEMFYGRTDELAAVVDLNGPSFVSGGRQLGKSALLRVAKRRFESVEGRHAVLTSVFTVGGNGRPERLWGVLWPHLARLGIVEETPPAGVEDLAQVVYAAVLKWLDEDSARALLILLDEADAFLDADAAGAQFKHVDTCRQLMWDSGRRAKVVFAGLHRTARFESLPNQPLSHLGRPISVGPLRPQHAHELITEPLTALGFTFADPIALPARILAMANNMPALLQLFGQALVSHLGAQRVPPGGPPQVITSEDVDDVFADSELRAAFREKYVLTLNLDHRYLVIAYTVAAAAHEYGVDHSLNLVELSDAARLHWPEGFGGVGADDFRGLVAECVDLGVLAADGGRYRLRTPTVQRLLGTEEEVLEILYTASERMVVPSVSDGGSYRRPVGSSRSVLTEGQLGRLFDARRQVLTVTGSAALGGDAVMAAVEAAWSEEAHRVGAVNKVQTATPDGVRAAVARATAESALLLVDGQNLSVRGLCELLSAAEVAVSEARRDVTVAVVTSPGNAGAWAPMAARIDLDRVDEPGLRMWCDEEGLPFRDEEARAQLMAVTGGWPRVVAHAAVLTGAAGPAAGSSKVLADLAVWLDADGGKRLVAGAGLGPGTPALTAALRAAVDFCGTDGEDSQTLLELLEMDERVDLARLAADAGFGSLADVVAALTALGCLTATSGGLLRPEPVLAAQLSRVLSTTAADSSTGGDA